MGKGNIVYKPDEARLNFAPIMRRGFVKGLGILGIWVLSVDCGLLEILSGWVDSIDAAMFLAVHLEHEVG